MPDTTPIRLGLIGCGNISALHLRGIAALPGVSVTALADLNEEHIAAVREDFPSLSTARSFTDYHDLLATDVDGVIIMTRMAFTTSISATLCAPGNTS